MPDARDLIRKLEEAHAEARTDDAGSFFKLAGPLKDLSGALRVQYKSTVAAAIGPVIDKLEEGQALTRDEIDLVESFVTGDAEAHVRLEKDFQRSVAELDRLVKTLADRSRTLQGRVLLDALGEVADSQRVVSDICVYLEDRDRVARFRRSFSGGVDRARGKVLAEILKQQLLTANG